MTTWNHLYIRGFSAILLVVLIAVYAKGLFIPLMHNDSGYHALIALQMHLTGDFVTLLDKGNDYLDKPHFLFWSAAFFYKILGVKTVSYKLTSVLFSLLTIFSTYQLGTVIYNRKAGLLAAAILSTSFAFIQLNHDVRMDAILTGTITFSIWTLVSYIEKLKFKYLLLASIGLAVGFATKGLIGIVVPAIATIFYILGKRKLNIFLKPHWLLLGVIWLALISPVLYCYYIQFDKHPEKEIRGQTGVSGVKFILFGQSFERYSGQSWGKQAESDPFYFFHTFAWAFLPWTFIAVYAIYRKARTLISRRIVQRNQQDYLTSGTILTMVVILSGSSFKLPHYLFIILPLFALLTAQQMLQCSKQTVRSLLKLQIAMSSILILLVIALNFWAFPIDNIWLVVVSTSMLLLLVFTLYSELSLRIKLIYLTCITGIVTGLLMSFNFYPKLLTYQAGKKLADYILQNYPEAEVRYLAGHEYSNDFDFYLTTLVKDITVEELDHFPLQHILIYTGQNGLTALTHQGTGFEIVNKADHYRITKLRLSFLNPETRGQVVQKHFIIKLNHVCENC